MVSIMPGMDRAEPERTDTSSGLSRPPKVLPVLLHRGHVRDAPGPVRRRQGCGVQVGQAGLGGDHEAGRHVEADLGHLAQVGALAAEQPLVLAVAFSEGVHPVFSGLVPDGYILINTTRSFDALGLGEFVAGFRPERLCTVPATDLALQHVGRPVPNAALLGGFAAVTGKVSIDSVCAAIRERFGGKVAAGNVAAATEAWEFVRQEMRELSHA
jgi:hypothetical protein